MKKIIEEIEKVKEFTEKTFKLPIIYIVFLIDIFLLWQPKYVLLINLSRWIHQDIKKAILTFMNETYDGIEKKMLIILFFIMVFIFLAEKTNFFSIVLPKGVEYSDGTEILWSEYNALNNIVNICVYVLSYYWIIYFTINIFLNEPVYVQNFLNSDIENNPLILNRYIQGNTLLFMNFVFYFNVLAVGHFILKALFEIKISENSSYLKISDLNHFVKINSFEKENNLEELHEIMILKKKNTEKDQFNLVILKKSKREHKLNTFTNEYNTVIEEVPYGKKTFKILNKSSNLNDIIYHYEVLKKENKIKQYGVY